MVFSEQCLGFYHSIPKLHLENRHIPLQQIGNECVLAAEELRIVLV